MLNIAHLSLLVGMANLLETETRIQAEESYGVEGTAKMRLAYGHAAKAAQHLRELLATANNQAKGK